MNTTASLFQLQQDHANLTVALQSELNRSAMATVARRLEENISAALQVEIQGLSANATQLSNRLDVCHQKLRNASTHRCAAGCDDDLSLALNELKICQLHLSRSTEVCEHCDAISLQPNANAYGCELF